MSDSREGISISHQQVMCFKHERGVTPAIYLAAFRLFIPLYGFKKPKRVRGDLIVYGGHTS